MGGVRTTAGGQTAQEQKQDHQGQGQEQEQEQEVRLADTVGGDGAKARPRGALDALIGIGVLIKGDTMHFECIANSCCNGLMQLGMASKTPVILGVLCCLSEDQAMERAGIGRGEFPGHNHGVDWAHAALEYVEYPARAVSGVHHASCEQYGGAECRDAAADTDSRVASSGWTSTDVGGFLRLACLQNVNQAQGPRAGQGARNGLRLQEDDLGGWLCRGCVA